MGEEIFGPLLPVLTYSSLDEAIRTVESHPHPLALYFFSEDKKRRKKVLDLCHFGGGCINDTIIHLATSAMPFGGVGESGMVDTTAWKASKPSVTLAALSTKNLDGSSDPVPGVCGMERKTFADVSAIVFLFLHFQN